jgi:glucose-1-phosphate adenylyltransferase
MAGQRILGIVLAGAAGHRLGPLTADRAKSAVPFGGLYRVVDFALSNLVNGGVRRIWVLTQYKSHSLNRHITTTWRLSMLLDNWVAPVPAQQRIGPQWQTGSADAIYQSLDLIYADRPDLVVVVGADHVYRMDPRQMIDQHLAMGSGATIAAVPVPRSDAAGFGVVQTAPDGRRIEAFAEKPANPPGRLGQPDESLVSMGNYVFDTDLLVQVLRKDAADQSSIVSGGLVRSSVLSPGARVDSWARVERSVIMHNSRVRRYAVVENAIVDKNVVIAEGATVGVDKELDRARGLVVSEGGITVVGKGQVVLP